MSSAATDWANKRRAQILRAEQLRAQRKAGIVDSNDSYAPKLAGARGANNTASNDSLDNLAGGTGSHKTGNSAHDDIFEVPLPGAGGAKKVRQAIFVDTDNNYAAPEPQLSPGSDTLGREMKRYSQDYDTRDTGSYLNQHKASKEQSDSIDGVYKSKFMKQYESPVPQARKTKDRKPENFFTEGGENERRSHAYQSPSRTFVFNGEDLAERKAQYEASLRHTDVEEAMDRQPSPQESSARARNKASSQARIEVQKEAEKEAEDEFLRSLRSDTNSNGHGGGNNKGGKPGWNDDFTTTSSTGLFGDPKPVPKRNRGTLKASAKVDTGRDSLSRRTKIGSAGVAPVANVGDDMPLPTSIKKDTTHPGFGAEYPEDYDPRQYGREDDSRYNRTRVTDRPQVPVRSSSPDGGGEQRAHARSRLSLLKNKIRLSENSGSRTSLKSSLERSRSDLHEHTQGHGRSSRARDMEEYGGADYDYGGSDSGTYNYEYDAYSAGMDGRDRDTHAYRDDNRSAGLNLGTDDGERRRGARARTGSGSREISSYSSREDGRDRDRDIERGTGRGHPGADSVAYRSRYAESVFDAADHPGNAHLYDRGSGGTQYGYEDNDRDRDRGAYGSEYQLDALDHYHDRPRDRDRGRTHETSSGGRSQRSSQPIPASASASSRVGGSGSYDIYSAAADMPGAYPEGEGPPADNEPTSMHHHPRSGGAARKPYGASRFDDNEEAAYDNPSHEESYSVFSRGNRATAHHPRSGSASNTDQGIDTGEYNSHYNQKYATERERARAKPSRAATHAQHQRNHREDRHADSGRVTSRSGHQRKYIEEEEDTEDEHVQGMRAYNHHDPRGYEKEAETHRRDRHPRVREEASRQVSVGDSGGKSGYDLSGIEDAEYAPQQPQRQCPDCGRSFNVDVYPKHAKICQKVFMSKRKAFDSKKSRILGLAEHNGHDAVKIAKDSLRKDKQANARRGGGHAGGSKSKWVAESQAFREAMKAAREVTKAMKTGAPLPPSMPSGPDPSLIPCPHCGRRFNQKAADRHIPQCANIKAKPTRLMKNSGMGAVASAKKGSTMRGVTF